MHYLCSKVQVLITNMHGSAHFFSQTEIFIFKSNLMVQFSHTPKEGLESKLGTLRFINLISCHYTQLQTI